MKRWAALLICLSLLFNLSAAPAYASGGEGNIDDGGGSMGSGTAKNYWHEGEDGVRVTVVRASDNEPVSTPVDLTNYDESNVQEHFKIKSKLDYRSGSSLVGTATTYNATKPSQSLPAIISNGGGNTNIDAIRTYFCSEWAIKKIAGWTGISYDKLTGGKYKLLLEPVAYFTFEGFKMAMTATEAALYDQKLSGGLRSKMVSLSHQNLPLSMFLQKADMGYPAYTGSTTKAQSDTTIINQLGLGIVKFTDDSTPETPSSSAATYRTDTDVITSVTLSSDDEIDPDHPAEVTFRIGGGTYSMTNIVMPEGEDQLVWCKWHTPSTPQTMNISVTSSKGSLSCDEITADIVSLDDHEPPDPTAADRNDTYSASELPSNSSVTSNSWGVWSGYWKPDWVWHEDWHWSSDSDSPTGGRWEDDGQWEDKGGWKYSYTKYRATLSADLSLMPSSHDWSAKGKKMKSGYGVQICVDGQLSSAAPVSHITAPQTALSYFPEFQYKTYWRRLDYTTSGTESVFHFFPNLYSTYSDRVHFTPLWFPDGKYTVYTYLEDAWTPAGMLSENLSDYVTIEGNVYDDWHIGPKLVE